MRRSTLVIGMVAAGCAGPRAFSDADGAAVRALLVDQQQAWNRGDLDRFMNGYARTPDLVFTSGGQVRGRSIPAGFVARRSYPEGYCSLGTVAVRCAIRAARPRSSIDFSIRGWRIVHDHTSVDSGN